MHWVVRSASVLLVLTVAKGGVFSDEKPLCCGPVDDATCDVEVVERANAEQLHSILQELMDTTFFRLIRVSVDRPCSFWEGGAAASCGSAAPAEDKPFQKEAPTMCSVTSERENVPWSPFSAPVDKTLSGLEGKAIDEMGAPADCDDVNSPTFWLDMCATLHPEEEDENDADRAHDTSSYINLRLNPERWTGYNGSKVWSAIYEENCFRRAGEFEEMCYEERVMYRLISGLHASTNIHIAANYFPPKKAKGETEWGANPEAFMNTFGAHPERLKNLHFSFVVLLRALRRVGPYINDWTFNTGNPEEDERTGQLVRRFLESYVLQSCGPVFAAFDESLLFQSHDLDTGADSQMLKTDFKDVFHNVSVLLDCVSCQKCRLHGKLHLLGLGSALKALLVPDHLVRTCLSRNELIALFNTIARFSDAIAIAPRMSELYWNVHGNYTLKKEGIEEEAPPPPVLSLTTEDDDVLMDIAIGAVARDDDVSSSEEDLLIRLAIQKNAALLSLARHYGADRGEFLRHARSNLQWMEPLHDVDSAYDVAVIGGGLAGLSCALAVLDRGGSVVVIDKENYLGGNSAWASSGINAVYGAGEDSVDLFFNDTMSSSGGEADGELVTALSASSGAALLWIRERLALKFDTVGRLGGHSAPRTWRPQEGMAGNELVFKLKTLLEDEYGQSASYSLKTGTRATSLLMNSATVTGVVVQGKDGQEEEVRARSVLIATGGFAADRGNESVLAEIRPDLVGLATTNGRWATGDGIRLARAVSARTVDLDNVQVHPTAFVHPSDPSASRKTLAAEILRGVGGILLDSAGKRFCDELGRRDYVTGRMFEQAKSTSSAPLFTILLHGAAAATASTHVPLYIKKGVLTQLSSLQDVAQWGGFDLEVLERTLSDYNEAAGGTRPDLHGRQSFESAPITAGGGPFFVGKVTPALHYTMGGIAIDDGGRVRAEGGGVIKGLYAAGEVTGGIHGKNRLGGNALTEAMVFGLRVGNSAAIAQHAGRPRAAAGGGGKDAPFSELPLVSPSEVATHTTAVSCWVVLHGHVYDFTDFLDDHPAGAQSILDHAGEDASELFDAIHNVGMLKDFLPIAKV